MAGIFSAHLVAMKCEVFTTASAREIQLCTRPATQQKRYPYFRQIAYASPLRMREDLSERGSIVPLSAQCINPVGYFKSHSQHGGSEKITALDRACQFTFNWNQT